LAQHDTVHPKMFEISPDAMILGKEKNV
jgi:hypothetical protein